MRRRLSSKLFPALCALALLLCMAAVLASQPDGGRDEATVKPIELVKAEALIVSEPAGDPPPTTAAERSRRKIPKVCPDGAQLAAAREWAATRSGSVGFAILDECKRLVGEHRFRRFYSASVVKAMLLAAFLRSDDVAGRRLDGDERDLLAGMIEWSDNRAADEVFGIVGETGLDELAADAGMRDFVSSPFWGGSEITAGDQASFLGRIERYVPKRHERFALRTLAGVIPDQRWGIAELVPSGWEIHFKGGWYLADDGWRVHQVATLRRHDRSFAIAVLSAGNPSFMYGRETIVGVAKRLLRPAEPEGGRGARRGSGASGR